MSRQHAEMGAPSPSEDQHHAIAEAVASLQLPHMPTQAAAAATTSGSGNHPTKRSKTKAPSATDHRQQLKFPSRPSAPSIRILVVADIDLPSASALAEYTVQQRNEAFDATMIDLCIACGSFCRDGDLLPYLRGKQRRKAADQQQRASFGNSNTNQQQQYNRQYHTGTNAATAASAVGATPFFRTRGQTAALEGLMTAALSQLESIVCRVVYCPGSTDPLSTIVPKATTSASTATAGSRRLTPNSRNLHQQWLPLAPGIGCGALLYLDSSELVLDELVSGDGDYTTTTYYRGQQQTKGAYGVDDDDDDGGGDDDSCNNSLSNNNRDDTSDRGMDEGYDERGESEMKLWCEQLRELQERYASFFVRFC